MLYVIKDLKIFDEFTYKESWLKTNTYYNAKKWLPITERTYKKICEVCEKKIEAIKLEKKQWFSIGIFFTDHDLRMRKHKEFHSYDPEDVRKQAASYLSDPDNARDIRKDEQPLSNDPE